MKLFANIKGYATPANAEMKLRAVLGSRIDNVRWLISVTDEGRYVPVVVHDPKQETLDLIHTGIAVVG